MSKRFYIVKDAEDNFIALFSNYEDCMEFMDCKFDYTYGELVF